MNTQALTTVSHALGIAAFVRKPDGSFESLAPAPDWFIRVKSGETFPFLGHILEEAAAFWQRGTPGRADWGPVAETDSDGHEYHYTVSALTANGEQFLVFQLDAGADRLRSVLQKVRSEALSAEQDHASHRALSTDLHTINSEVRSLLERLAQTQPSALQTELINGLSEKSQALANGIGRLVQSTSVRRA
jgi:hypothetical protein